MLFFVYQLRIVQTVFFVCHAVSLPTGRPKAALPLFVLHTVQKRDPIETVIPREPMIQSADLFPIRTIPIWKDGEKSFALFSRLAGQNRAQENIGGYQFDHKITKLEAPNDYHASDNSFQQNLSTNEVSESVCSPAEQTCEFKFVGW